MTIAIDVHKSFIVNICMCSGRWRKFTTIHYINGLHFGILLVTKYTTAKMMHYRNNSNSDVLLKQ
jgi:hypothetical protein